MSSGKNFSKQQNNKNMFDKISLASMCAYERITKNNAMTLFSTENKSASDLRDLAFLIKRTKDKTCTLESIEELSSEEFNALLSSISEASGSVAK